METIGIIIITILSIQCIYDNYRKERPKNKDNSTTDNGTDVNSTADNSTINYVPSDANHTGIGIDIFPNTDLPDPIDPVQPPVIIDPLQDTDDGSDFDDLTNPVPNDQFSNLF
jgi:hypothetical protein